MAQTLIAPASISPGSTVVFQDGTTGTVGSDSSISVPASFVAAFLNAGFTYQTATSAQTSQAASKGDSGGTVASQATSIATSEAAADSQTVSTADSKGVSSGTAA